MHLQLLMEELNRFGIEFRSDAPSDTVLSGVSVFPNGKSNTLSMWRKKEPPTTPVKCQLNNVILCTEQVAEYFSKIGLLTIVVNDPRVAFAVMANNFLNVDEKKEATKPISELAQIGDNTHIGHNVVLGDVKVGNNCVIGNNVVVKSNTVIGNNVEIGDNTTIGGVGFGYVELPDGTTFQVPHLGGVEIADGVHIGSNTCIDRGSIGNTVIGSNSRIDNLVHIAHNVQIGKGVFVIAGAEISGSVKIGDKAWIAPNACVREGLTIGANAVVGLGSVVVKDVAEGITVMGVPARPKD
jgi:UDP-3-O-[3-hydroxymyristoyl] glucosamine N-acyltransferase